MDIARKKAPPPAATPAVTSFRRDRGAAAVIEGTATDGGGEGGDAREK